MLYFESNHQLRFFGESFKFDYCDRIGYIVLPSSQV